VSLIALVLLVGQQAGHLVLLGRYGLDTCISVPKSQEMLQRLLGI